MALAAAIANAFAVVLQAAEDRQSPAEQGGRFSLLFGLARRPRWLAGVGLVVFAWPLQILALGLAPITVVQPTLASSQLVLVGIARFRLRERIGMLEIAGAAAIAVGVSIVVAAAPHHENTDPSAGRVAVPLALVGVGALGTYALFRLRPAARLAVVIGAGLAYAWVDFVNKLLANDISKGNLALAAVWLVATIGFGAIAFLQETTALQVRPAVTVSPVVGAIQDPLPVLMALWAGVEVWGSTSSRILPLAFGLALVASGAALLGRSRAVARVSGEETPSQRSRPRPGARPAR